MRTAHDGAGHLGHLTVLQMIKKEICVAFDGKGCYIVLPVMPGMPELKPSICSKVPDG